MQMRTYSELIKLPTFLQRYEYLRLNGVVGESTFGFDRYLNQLLYSSRRWKSIRDIVIVRDNGLNLGAEGYEIRDRVVVHHMNPLSVDEIERGADIVFDPEFLISTTHDTHLAIHYSNNSMLPVLPTVRKPNDTSPWKNY